MAIVGAVEIDLVARVARLQTDLDKATGLIKGFKDKSVQHFDGMSRAAENVGRTITAMVSVAGLSMLANFTKSVADETDQLINQAKYLGISTDKLSAFQHMALLAGVSSEAMTDALGKFAKGLGNAADGTGPVAEQIRALGLSVEKLRSMLPDEAFLSIGEAISKMSSASDKAAATTAIFGRSSIGLINVFEKMPANLAEATAEIEHFGLSLSKQDEKKVQALDDSFDRLAQSIKGASRALVLEFADGIKTAVDASAEAPNLIAEGWRGLMFALKSGQLFTNKTLQQLAEESEIAAEKAMKPWQRAERELARIDAKKPNQATGAVDAVATPGFTADQWQRILDESAKNHQALFGISDKYWLDLQERSAENYLLELDSVAMAQDAQVEAYRNHFANLDAEHAVHLEKWRADEEALNADMGAVWERQQQNEERMNDMRWQAQSSTFAALADLMGQFAGKSKAAAQAQLLITKSIAIFDIIANSQRAAALAQATIPPPGGQALAASIMGWGYAQAGLVGVSAAVQSASIANGGGSSFNSGSSGSRGGGSSPATTPSGSSSQPQQQQKTPIVIQVNVNGSILTDTAFNEVLRENLAEFFNKDGVLIQQNSAQARAIAA